MRALVMCLVVLSKTFYVQSETKHNRTNAEGFILQGYDASITSYPYAVFLHIQNGNPRICGGSLIFVQVVLTAANCMVERAKGCRVGASMGHEIPYRATIRRHVIAHKFHPHFDERKQKNNIALAFLDTPVVLGVRVKKIPLTSAVAPTDISEVHFAVGWGRQFYPYDQHRQDDPQARKLMGTKQRLVSESECSKYATAAKIRGSHMCTLPIGGHFYKDDVGAGLVSKTSKAMFLTGVLSYIIDSVAVYTDLVSSRDWIVSGSIDLFEKTCNMSLHRYRRVKRRQVDFNDDNLSCYAKGKFPYIL